MDYEKAYKILFNSITDALDYLNSEQIFTKETEKAKEILILAQQQAEDLFIEP